MVCLLHRLEKNLLRGKIVKKKTKFLMKIDRNNTGKVYINGKYMKSTSEITVQGYPLDYDIEITQYKHNADGKPFVENGELATETKKYHIGR